jgi:hypothetical protein
MTRAHTNMSIILGDVDGTVVPFMVRADSTQPYVQLVRYTDPISKHLNAAEAAIANRLQADVNDRVNRLAEERLQQRLLLAGEPVRLGKKASTGKDGDRLTLELEGAQPLPGDDGRPRLYVRYRVKNGTIAPLPDLHFVLRVDRTTRRFFLFERTVSREMFDVQDVRSSATVPAAGAVAGLLIIDDLDLKGGSESLSVEAVGFNGQRAVKIDRVMVGRDK